MFLKKYYYLWGAALILIGLFVAFYGSALLTFLFFVIAAIATFLFGCWAIYAILAKAKPDGVSTGVGWAIIAAMAILSLVAGYFFAKFRAIGLGLLAAWGGVCLGFLINTTFFVSNTWAYWAIIVGCALVVGLLTFYVQEAVVMVITSFIGSYAVIRGISLYAGGFPPETQLHRMIKEGGLTWDDFPKAFFGYLAGILILSILSAIYQFKHGKKTQRTSINK